jgi:hypothetical protein
LLAGALRHRDGFLKRHWHHRLLASHLGFGYRDGEWNRRTRMLTGSLGFRRCYLYRNRDALPHPPSARRLGYGNFGWCWNRHLHSGSLGLGNGNVKRDWHACVLAGGLRLSNGLFERDRQPLPHAARRFGFGCGYVGRDWGGRLYPGSWGIGNGLIGRGRCPYLLANSFGLSDGRINRHSRARLFSGSFRCCYRYIEWGRCPLDRDAGATCWRWHWVIDRHWNP